MKRILIITATILYCAVMIAQDISQFKALNDSAFQTNVAYTSGNKYQRDAILFVDMLADTHPYYITKARRDVLFAGQDALLKACATCPNDSVFAELLINTLGDLHDKHTDVIDLGQLEAKKLAAQQKAKQNIDNGNEMMSYKGDLFHYTLVPEQGVCYLQFNQCMDARVARNESLPRWDSMLDEMFGKMKEQGIKSLVVDAQYNNGGSSMLCDELLVRLCPLENIKMLSTSMRFSNLMASFNPRIAVAKQAWESDGHIDELYPIPAGKVGTGFVQPEVFDGKVVFVQSEKTYSSAGILMTLVRDNGIGKIVGTESSFSPSHYGEILPYRLPNTGILGTISCKYFARPDVDHLNDKSLVPDVTIDLSNKAQAWDQILSIVKQ